MMAKLAVLALAFFLATTVTAFEAAHDKHHSKDLIEPQFDALLPPVEYKQIHGLQGKNHSLILGSRRYGDSLLHIDVAKKSSKWFRIVETDIFFPAKNARNTKTINFIQVLDRKANGNNGWPYLTQGGIGAKNVTIHFKSQRGHGLDFIAYIYGY